jgi:lysozyme
VSKTPRLQESKIRKILETNGVDQSKVCAVAIRGYFLDTMGKPGVNDRRIYDDAQFICWPDGFAAFQANTDPNGYRKGHGTGSKKGMAMLKTGIHIFGTGKHKGRLAFRQCEKFTVIRDGNPPYEHFGYHAINWHSGGNYSTSSLGCQTNPKNIFINTLRPLVYSLLETYKNPYKNNDWGQKVRSLNYVLIDETERRKGNLLVSTRYL